MGGCPLGISGGNPPRSGGKPRDTSGSAGRLGRSADAVVAEDDCGWGCEDLGVVAGVGVVRDEVAGPGDAEVVLRRGRRGVECLRDGEAVLDQEVDLACDGADDIRCGQDTYAVLIG